MDEIRAVVFDLYGTLVHVVDGLNPYARLFLDLGMSPEEVSLARKIALTEDFEDLPSLVARLRPGVQIDTGSYERDISRELDSVRLYSEVMQVLKELEGRDMNLGVISNLASPYKRPFFALGIDGLVDDYLFSCEVGLKKPDKLIYQKMLESLQVAPNHVLMVGDNIYCDVYGPESVGMNAVLLDRDGKSDYPARVSYLGGILRYC